MKFLALLIFVSASASIQAAESKCKDQNFLDMYGVNHYEIQDTKKFKVLFESDSTAPAGYDEYFNPLGNELCQSITATYIQHISSSKKYVMYTTHEDYCDGGNTLGVIIDLEKYSNQKIDDAIAAEVGDGEIYCTK